MAKKTGYKPEMVGGKDMTKMMKMDAGVRDMSKMKKKHQKDMPKKMPKMM